MEGHKIQFLGQILLLLYVNDLVEAEIVFLQSIPTCWLTKNALKHKIPKVMEKLQS